MSSHDDATFQAAVDAAPAEMQAVARRLRERIYELHPDAVEVVWQTEGSVGYGFGPAKMSEHYAYLRPFTRHVNLGFFHGVELDDPEDLLEGSGKRLRHVKVRTLAEAERPGLRSLLEAAVAERRRALDER